MSATVMHQGEWSRRFVARMMLAIHDDRLDEVSDLEKLAFQDMLDRELEARGVEPRRKRSTYRPVLHDLPPITVAAQVPATVDEPPIEQPVAVRGEVITDPDEHERGWHAVYRGPA